MSTAAWKSKAGAVSVVPCRTRGGTMAEGLEVAEQWLARKDLRRQWQQKRQKLLDDSEDVTAFMVQTIRRAAKPSGYDEFWGHSARTCAKSRSIP